MSEIDYFRKSKRKQTMTSSKSIISSYAYKFFNRFLITIIITLIVMIILNNNIKLKQGFYKNIYDNHFSFAPINKLYQDNFGKPLPFIDFFKNELKPVFNETLTFSETAKYKDGVKLIVDDNYLVPAMEDGIVIFIGDKDDYKNTVIVQHSSGIDVWYSNVDNLNVKLYDYIKKGSLIGEAINENLYMIFQRDGVMLDYKDYI